LIAFGKNYEYESIIINRKTIKQGKKAEESHAVDITSNLVKGKNLLAFVVSDIKGNDAGLIFSIEIIYSDGNIEIISSGEDCKVSAIKIPGWDNPAINDSRWADSRVIRNFGLDDLIWLKSSRPAPRSTIVRKEFTAKGK